MGKVPVLEAALLPVAVGFGVVAGVVEVVDHRPRDAGAGPLTGHPAGAVEAVDLTEVTVPAERRSGDQDDAGPDGNDDEYGEHDDVNPCEVPASVADHDSAKWALSSN
jgi:hypothetical protein